MQLAPKCKPNVFSSLFHMQLCAVNCELLNFISKRVMINTDDNALISCIIKELEEIIENTNELLTFMREKQNDKQKIDKRKDSSEEKDKGNKLHFWDNF